MLKTTYPRGSGNLHDLFRVIGSVPSAALHYVFHGSSSCNRSGRLFNDHLFTLLCTRVLPHTRAMSSSRHAIPLRYPHVLYKVGHRTLAKTSYGIFDLALSMGVRGAFALAKEVSPYMLKRGHGTMLFTSATAAYRGNQYVSV